MLAFTGLFISSVLNVASLQSSPVMDHCQTVRARYEIYANGDRLWVIGSKHLLSVVVDPLDTELQKRGWENTVAFGNFTICFDRRTDPRNLNVRDRVVVTSYGDITYRNR